MSSDWKIAFKDKLLAILGARGVISSDDELIAYECDALTGYRVKPVFVVLPETAEQVSGLSENVLSMMSPMCQEGRARGYRVGRSLPKRAL